MNIVQQIKEGLKELFQWWITISPWEQGLRVKLGKHVTLLQPGVHLRIPLIHQTFVQPTRLRAHFVEGQIITTADGKPISIASSMRYEVHDILKLYTKLHNAHDTITQKAQGAIASFMRERSLSQITATELEKFVAESLAHELDNYGLQLYSFNVTDFAVCRTYRFLNTGLGMYSDYNSRMDTRSADGDTKRL